MKLKPAASDPHGALKGSRASSRFIQKHCTITVMTPIVQRQPTQLQARYTQVTSSRRCFHWAGVVTSTGANLSLLPLLLVTLMSFWLKLHHNLEKKHKGIPRRPLFFYSVQLLKETEDARIVGILGAFGEALGSKQASRDRPTDVDPRTLNPCKPEKH